MSSTSLLLCLLVVLACGPSRSAARWSLKASGASSGDWSSPRAAAPRRLQGVDVTNYSGDELNVNGLPVDHCLNFGEDCGAPAALFFCTVLKRHTGVAGYKRLPSASAHNSTYLPKTGETCEGTCGGFEYIECSDATGPRFEAPTFNGLPLDRCNEFSATCDQPTAEFFCTQLHGYSGVAGFKLSAQNYTTTSIAAAEDTCITDAAAPGCGSFEYIECSGSDARYSGDELNVNGLPIDHCLNFAEDCGAPAARAFCTVLKTHSGVAGFKTMPETVTYNATYILGTGATCEGTCGGFEYIECTDTTGPRFEAPTFNGLPLDWCLTTATDCGLPAAQFFCTQLHGYTGVADWRGGYSTLNSATFIAGEGKTCITDPASPGCGGFEYIECSGPTK